MNYQRPFYVRGIRVSVRSDGKAVTVYHKYPDVTEEQKFAIDNVIQYLMTEDFVKTKTCRVDIQCE